MADQPDFSIETYLDRVDARLAELDDDSEKITFIKVCIEFTEQKRERFEQTLDTRYGLPEQITANLDGLHERLERLTMGIRLRIAEAEAALETPMISDFVAAALARRHGFDLPSARIAERVH